MVLNGIEAYSVKHYGKGKYRLETCGALFGYEVKLNENKILYQIEMANVDTSAERSENSVLPNRVAMNKKANIMSKYWPHIKYIGDYHTHPYNNIAEVLSTEIEKGASKGDNKGYYLSVGDRDWLNENSVSCKECGYKVGLLITIAELKRKGKILNNITNSQMQTIEFNLDDLKIWISAYYTFEKDNKLFYSKNNDKNITIECPSIIGFSGEV